MPTHREIADHLGIDESRVSRHVRRMGIDWSTATMDEIRLAYIEHMRNVTAWSTKADEGGLTEQRVLTARVDRELKQMQLAEKQGQLVNLAQLRPALLALYSSYERDLRERDRALKAGIDELYGIDVDQRVIDAYGDNALAQLAHFRDAAP